MSLSQTYDGYGEVVQRTWTGPGGVELLVEDMTRDALGRIATKTERWLGVEEGRSYAYDVSGRLVRVDAEGDALRRYGILSSSIVRPKGRRPDGIVQRRLGQRRCVPPPGMPAVSG